MSSDISCVFDVEGPHKLWCGTAQRFTPHKLLGLEALGAQSSTSGGARLTWACLACSVLVGCIIKNSEANAR